MATKEMESWDDDLELHGPIFTQSTSTHPASISSRLSLRSESNAGEDDWNVPLSVNDESSTSNAILSAKLAGIPIPSNVPPSALLGGAIKRLGKKVSKQNIADDWGDDLDLPTSTDDALKIKPLPQDPATPADEFEDLDWADGSLGVRFGGTRRASKNRSSSASAMSPSLASNKTFESEEDGLGGLVLPSGPVDFETVLRKRRDAPPLEHTEPTITNKDAPRTPVNVFDNQREDFFADIDFGTGDVFDPRKNTLNRNIKPNWKPVKDSGSAATKTQTTLTFTEKANNTRIPRPVTTPRSTRLEPVYETGATAFTKARRPEPTTTNAQLLRSKRSMPALRQHQPLSKASPAPYIPATIVGSQNRQAGIRVSQHNRRDSDPTRPQSPTLLRAHSRLSAAMTPDTPTRQRRDVAPAALAREAAAKRTVTRPARRRNFGDGTELDTFDDLPTSAAKESLFTKQPVARGQPKALRHQPSQSRLGIRDKITTQMPPAAPAVVTGTPRSPTKTENLPRFARDTAASRIAREQTLGSTKPRSEGPLMPRTNWPAQVAARTPTASPTANRTKRKGPQLVAHMGKENIRHFQEDAAKKGMHWNAALCCWEGNENAVLAFDPPAPASPPRPALITNIQGSQGVQVVGGMVFDPQRMCWLKLGATPSDPLSPSVGDEEDPFRDIEDLHDSPRDAEAGGATGAKGTGVGGDWLVGEEFDLGPEFIRRQREEEATWRARVGGWFGEERETDGERWKWAIREIAAGATGR